MDKTSLSPIQKAILSALEAQGDKAKYPETVLAKKIRSDEGIETKKKAIIALSDLEKVIAYQEENDIAHYAITMNSANDLLIERTEVSKPLSPEAHQRRLRSEKSMTIFTNKDVQKKI